MSGNPHLKCASRLLFNEFHNCLVGHEPSDIQNWREFRNHTLALLKSHVPVLEASHCFQNEGCHSWVELEAVRKEHLVRFQLPLAHKAVRETGLNQLESERH